MRDLACLMFSLVLGFPALAGASGCYICVGGSKPSCPHYCAYSGADTFDTRHQCEHKGCRIGGTTSCPNAGTNVHICQAQAVPERIPWCAAEAPDYATSSSGISGMSSSVMSWV